jgi:hypothetical protein
VCENVTFDAAASDIHKTLGKSSSLMLGSECNIDFYPVNITYIYRYTGFCLVLRIVLFRLFKAMILLRFLSDLIKFDYSILAP